MTEGCTTQTAGPATVPRGARSQRVSLRGLSLPSLTTTFARIWPLARVAGGFSLPRGNAVRAVGSRLRWLYRAERGPLALLRYPLPALCCNDLERWLLWLVCNAVGGVSLTWGGIETPDENGARAGAQIVPD